MKISYIPYVGPTETYEVSTLDELHAFLMDNDRGVFEHIRIAADVADDGTKSFELDDVNWGPLPWSDDED